jgi:hypothetical protein
MPVIKENPIVTCLMCHTKQEDLGKRTTCIKCGFEPIPSYSYDRDNIFHPRFVRPRKKSLKDLVTERRALRRRQT